MTPFKQWMKAAQPAEQERMAVLAGTTRPMLYQYSNSETTNRRFSAERGGAIAKASEVLHRETGGRLPVLKRGDLVEACAKCEHFKAGCPPCSDFADRVVADVVADLGKPLPPKVRALIDKAIRLHAAGKTL